MTRRTSLTNVTLQSALLLSMASGFMSSAAAAELGENAQPIRVGQGNLYLGAQLRYLNDDNKNRSLNDPLEINGLVFSPTAVFQADKGSINFQASYEGGYGSFDESNFDFDDHVLKAGVGTVLTRRLRVGADASFIQRHDEFDIETSTGNFVKDDLVISRNSRVNAGLVYGAQNARGNLSADLLFFRHEVDELDAGSSNIAPNYELVQPALELSLRMSEDTRFTIGLTHGLYDYDNDNADRTITSGLVGLSFSPTGKLQGFFRVGSAYSDYDSGVNETVAVFNSVITYRPVTRSRFTLRAARRLDNSDDSVIDFSNAGTTSDVVKLEWRHQWRSHFATDAYVSWEGTDRVCPSADDDYTSAGLKGIFSFLSSWTLSLGVQHDTRSGYLCEGDLRDADILDYDRQKVDVIIGYTL